MPDQKSNEEIFFTIIPHQTGFTDQLNQFNALYRLGNHLGYKYYHTKFSSPRSTFTSYNFQPGFISRIQLFFQLFNRKIKLVIPGLRSRDIFDLLGINSYLNRNKPEINKYRIDKVWVNLNPKSNETGNLNTFSQIENYVKSKVNAKKSKKKLVVFNVERGRSFIDKIISSIPRHPTQNGLRDEYLRLRNANNWRSKYETPGIKLLVQIRLGDTSLIKTPWDTYISSWSIHKNNFNETSRKEEVESPRHINLEDYKKLLDAINSEFSNSEIGTLIFSDGYERAFQRIIRFREKYNFSRNQASQLMNSRKIYKKEFYRMFDDINNSKIIYGEGTVKLLDLVHAIFDSDLIVVGTVQGMIINFLSNYFDKDSMPLVAVLYRQKKPNYLFLIQQDLKDKFKFIDVESPDYSAIIDFIYLKIYGSPE